MSHVTSYKIKKKGCLLRSFLIGSGRMLLFTVEQVFLWMGEICFMHDADTQCTGWRREEVKWLITYMGARHRNRARATAPIAASKFSPQSRTQKESHDARLSPWHDHPRHAESHDQGERGDHAAQESDQKPIAHAGTPSPGCDFP